MRNDKKAAQRRAYTKNNYRSRTIHRRGKRHAHDRHTVRHWSRTIKTWSGRHVVAVLLSGNGFINQCTRVALKKKKMKLKMKVQHRIRTLARGIPVRSSVKVPGKGTSWSIILPHTAAYRQHNVVYVRLGLTHVVRDREEDWTFSLP